jgi:hypothetical protein
MIAGSSGQIDPKTARDHETATLLWTTPAGRTYTAEPTRYPI